MLLSTRATVKKITQNNPAEPLGQHETNEFKWFSFSDDTHIHDRAQILKKGLLPRHPGSSPTSYTFVDKFVFAFFPTAASKIRNLPPIHAKNLRQTVLKTANPLSPAMPPCLVTRANSPCRLPALVFAHFGTQSTARTLGYLKRVMFTSCKRLFENSPPSHSEHCLTIIASSFHTQSVVHTIAENRKRGVVQVVLEICSTSIKIVICIESRECPVQTSVKTGTTLIIVTLTI